MTDNQINVAIAEACGWKWEQIWTGELQGKPIGEQGPLRLIPNYCNDLNEMHEALKTLPPDQLWDVAYSLPMETMLGFMATARELAETFLMVIGKYKGATTEQSSVDHLRDAAKMMRFQAAIAAMQGHIVHRGFSENGKHVADLAIRHTDALIAALKNEVQP